MHTAEQDTTPSGSNRSCLIITIIVAVIGLLACILAVVLILVVSHNFTSLPPGSLETPEPPVYIEVLPDRCTVRRAEVTGRDLRGLTWVLLDRSDNPVLETSAEQARTYRHPVPGKYVVFLKAWIGDSYVPVSREVLTACP